MPDVLKTIQVLVAPVVMISAGGLLSLALYNRLAAIVARVRVFNKERVDAGARLAQPNELAPAQRGHLQDRCELLEEQVRSSLSRAVLVRNAILSMLAMVICMLLSSLCLGLALLAEGWALVALGFFLLGVIAMMLAATLASMELLRCLDPVQLEHAGVSEAMDSE